MSADESGILEYWTGAKYDYKFPKRVKFESKLDTDLYEFFKCKTYPTGLCFNKQGNKFATISLDRKVSSIWLRIFVSCFFFFCQIPSCELAYKIPLFLPKKYRNYNNFISIF